MNISTAVRKRVEELAKEKNLSLVELDRLAGLSYNTVYQSGSLKNGHYKMLNMISIYCICRALKMTLREFFSSSLFENVEYERKR